MMHMEEFIELESLGPDKLGILFDQRRQQPWSIIPIFIDFKGERIVFRLPQLYPSSQPMLRLDRLAFYVWNVICNFNIASTE
jgi:hypothetical protein